MAKVVEETVIEERRGWHLDKTVNVSLLIVLVMQFCGWIWFAAKQDARIEANDFAISELKKTNEAMRNEITELKGRVIEIGTKMDILLTQTVKGGKNE